MIKAAVLLSHCSMGKAAQITSHNISSDTRATSFQGGTSAAKVNKFCIVISPIRSLIHLDTVQPLILPALFFISQGIDLNTPYNVAVD